MTKLEFYLKPNTILKTLYIALMLAISQHTFADATLSYKASNGEYRLQLKNKQLFIQNVDNGTDLIYNESSDEVTIVQHQKKKYLILNEAELQQLNQQISGLTKSITSNLTSDQRDQLNSFLGGALGSEQPKVANNYALKGSGSAQVGNFFCQQFQVLENGKNFGSICTASAQQIKISPADYNTLMAFQRFAIKASNILQDSVASIAQVSIPDLSKTPVNEFLIFSKIESQSDGDFYLQNSDQNSINANFNIPTNYQRGRVSAASFIR